MGSSYPARCPGVGRNNFFLGCRFKVASFSTTIIFYLPLKGTLLLHPVISKRRPGATSAERRAEASRAEAAAREAAAAEEAARGTRDRRATKSQK